MLEKIKIDKQVHISNNNMLSDSPHIAHDESSLSQVRHTEQVQHGARFGCVLSLHLINTFMFILHVKTLY